MKLLTKELIDKMPKLYANEDKKPEDVKIIVKFFCPWNSQWVWYATEMEKDGEDFRFFGYVRGFENELGYFMLSQLKSVKKFGLGIERDLHFGEHTLAEVMKERL